MRFIRTFGPSLSIAGKEHGRYGNYGLAQLSFAYSLRLLLQAIRLQWQFELSKAWLEQYYGKASQYMQIFEANREIISDPNKIYPGQKIRIPLD